MKTENLLQYADILLKTAITKTHNVDEAQDLVQDTYLCALLAITNGAAIKNPKAYLFSILQNRFFLSLRKKYRISTISINAMPIEINDDNNDFESIDKTDEAKAIRRELAFLTHIYREVMVRYYMQNQSVEHIAKELSIPKGTVLSRLDAGRKKVKKGVETMQSYIKNSYQPEILTIGMNGRTGQKDEPFSCVKNSIDQNILILAYEKPVTIQELSEALGIPMAFVEESVNNLVDSQLMKREGTKVFTDFIIISLKDSLIGVEISKKFAKDSFDEANSVFKNMVKKYKEIEGFSAFNDTQLYIMAVLSSRQNFTSRITMAITGKDRDFDDYPDRPNFGKWIVIGSQYPNGYSFNDERARYSVSGRTGCSDINEYISGACEWDTPVGHTHHLKFKYSISEKERAIIIDAVRTNTVNAFQAELIPDLEKNGFIKTENGIKKPSIPFITKKDEIRFFEIESAGAKEYCSLLLNKAVDVIKENIIKYPKHISLVSDLVYENSLFYLPMAYIYEAAEKGIITIEKDKSYPIMYINLR